MGHLSETGREYELPQMGAEYCFAGGSELEREDVPILVLYERTSKPLFGHKVDQKGVSDSAADQVARDLDSTGFNRIVIRTDTENPITALMRDVKARWQGELDIEEATPEDSDSNGLVETGVKLHQGLVRARKIAVEVAVQVALFAEITEIAQDVKIIIVIIVVVEIC